MKNFLLIAIISYCSISMSMAQGCSDAGFCTLDNMKPKSDSTSNIKNRIKLGAFIGGADNDIMVYGNYFEYGHAFSKRFGIDFKLTTLSQNGDITSTFGLSDVFVTGNYKFNDKFTVTFGGKIPLNDANNKKDGVSLPMDYQTSLGTVDLILGASYKWKKWQFTTALQQPITQNNNTFGNTVFPLNSPFIEFQPTNNYKRSGDVLLRIAYPFTLSEKWSLTASMLPIYHLNNDKWTDVLGVEREIKGSQGLTLNGNLFLDYKLNATNAFQLNIGMPFVVREERPDGLTRSLVANVEYKYNF